MKGVTRWAVTGLVGAVLGGALAAPGTPGGMIAYVTETSNHVKQFHEIRPDGTGHRVILTLPNPSGWPTLAFGPDGRELAFVSDHAQTRSLYQADLYTVQVDGKNLRRITNAFSPPTNGLKASVTVDVRIAPPGPTEPANPTGPFFVYVEGAPDSKTVLASGKVRFDNVAVVPGHAPYIVVMSGTHRWIRPGSALVPGRVNDLSFIDVTGNGLHEFGARAPSWKADGGALLFGFGDCCLYRVAARPPAGTRGDTLVEGGIPPLVAYAPTRAKRDQFLYSALESNGVSVRLGSEGAPTGRAVLTVTKLMGLAWLPSGSGFVFVTDDTGPDSFTSVSSNIWEHDLASGKDRQITHFTQNFVYNLSVSPDGQQIAFEYGTDTDIDGIWLVDRDGSRLHRLVRDGLSPAWGVNVNP
ncbi:hypothetical protein [Deinococcus sp.]|uniref:hypothetical protein n=1 Tax=Deinococcus sp. TaxID=47478 RepID=UPI002869ACD4|nr:hypothetical protein [Deinococcus sp.]